MGSCNGDWQRLNARGECPTHQAIGFALAIALGCDDALIEGAEEQIAELACDLADARLPERPEDELIEVGRVLDEWLLCDEPESWRGDLADLLLPTALATGTGAECAVVSAALAACQRAGLPFGVVASERHLYLVHHGLNQPYVLAPRYRWRFIEAGDLREGDLVHLCPHELAKRSLDEMAARSSQLGRPDLTLAVAGLRVDLPTDDRTRQSDQRELAMARARFN